ncbi:hypothetical protein BGZ70_005163, partial [Mortierella alpina]
HTYIMLRQITRTLPRSAIQIRSFTAARSVEEPSANYTPGKQGFAPGMPHPPGTSASPSPPPAPRTDSLPEMSKSHQIKANGSPEQKYKLEMTKLRHAYQREHFASEDAKRTQKEKHRQGSLRRVKALQSEDRIENERRLAFERLMQPNGQMASTGAERQAQVAEFVKARKIKRQQNFQKQQELNEFYETGLTLQSKVYVSGVEDLVAEVMENGGQVAFPDLLKREQELKDALDGTVSGGKVGYEGAKAKVDSA